MNTLRLVSLFILAGLAIGLFVMIYPKMQGISTSKRAKETSDNLNSRINQILTTDGSEKVDIKVPGGYKLSFENKKIQTISKTRPLLQKLRRGCLLLGVHALFSLILLEDQRENTSYTILSDRY